jgi:hypothetical protein
MGMLPAYPFQITLKLKRQEEGSAAEDFFQNSIYGQLKIKGTITGRFRSTSIVSQISDS